MPIAALPSDTIRAIGASQVLTDSASLVKELVDNALDARACAVFIEISPNSLDNIQVKDNGFGIAPVDRELVCKRYCTSKITSFEDIAIIGGQSLGFRGEALASAAEMSGSLHISTRVEGEATAVNLKIGCHGAIENEERISHPVGTTVRITDFLDTIPVRRQSALKNNSKILSKIKTSLQAYALARPNVKFSLKVLKAKTEKGNLIYAPKPKASTADAATKIIGKKVTEQCQWKLWSSMEADHQSVSSQDMYRFECLLPKPQCDIQSISNTGQYLSVDSRPVSCTRGIFKQIVSLFKSCLKSTLAEQNAEKILNPFFCMNLVCPAGSYDANVEPAKDDVMFADADLVLKLVECFFRSVYGEARADESTPMLKRPKSRSNQGFDLLLAQKESTPEQHTNQTHNCRITAPSSDDRVPDKAAQHQNLSSITTQGRSITAVSPKSVDFSEPPIAHPSLDTNKLSSAPPWKRNMYAVSDDDEDLMGVYGDNRDEVNPLDLHEESELRSAQVSNPWTIAKVNTSLHKMPNQSMNSQQLTPARQKGDLENIVEYQSNTTLPVARALPSPERTQTGDSSGKNQSSSPEYFPYPLTARRPPARNADARSSSPVQSPRREHSGTGTSNLDTWVQRSHVHLQSPSSTIIDESCPMSSSSDIPSTQAYNETLSTRPQDDNTRPYDFVSARTLPTGTPLTKITSLPQRRPRRSGGKSQGQQGAGIKKPFVSPVNDPQKVWFEVGPSSGRGRRSPQKRNIQNKNMDQGLFLGSNDIEPVADANVDQDDRALGQDGLAATLDYETRKADAIHQRKVFLRQQAMSEKQLGILHSSANLSASSNSPHTNRYNKAVAALSDEDASLSRQTNLPEDSSLFEPGNPIAYLLRLQSRSQMSSTRSERERSISPSRARSGTSARRRKTAMLPLESISEGSSTRDLEILVPSLDLQNIKRNIKSKNGVDGYVRSGKIVDGLRTSRSIDIVRGWEDELRLLMDRLYKVHAELGEQLPHKVEVWTALLEHFGAHGGGTNDDSG